MTRVRACLFASLSVALTAIAGRAEATPAVWTAHGAQATAVLFGSVHLLPRGVDWKPEALTQALAHADEIWFELPIDQTTDAEAVRLTRVAGLWPKSDNLFNHLSAGETARLRDVCARLGISTDEVAPLRPWLADVTLSLIDDARHGAAPSQGVEEQVQDATPPGARRRAFETPAQQIALLARASMADQLASLDESLEELADDPDAYQRVVGEWMAGDLAGLAKDAIEPIERASPALYRRLIADRNQRWAAVLARRLTGKGIIVVVVGAGHLIGPEGVPALLRARGVRVDGPQ